MKTKPSIESGIRAAVGKALCDGQEFELSSDRRAAAFVSFLSGYLQDDHPELSETIWSVIGRPAPALGSLELFDQLVEEEA